jgi:hypothetical protein
MPQSNTLLIDHVVQGQLQKEVPMNEAINILERKLTNSADIDLAGTGDYDASLTEIRDMRLNLTGILTGNRTFTVPARNMLYLVENSTTGAFTIDMQVIGGAGVSIPLGRGYQTWVWCDGTDCIDLTRQLTEYVADVTTTYQVTEYDRIVNGDTSGGAFTITLPQAAPGKQVLINSIGAATTLTIARGGTDTIKGVTTSITIATQWQAVLFVGESATNWLAFRLTVA